MCIELSFHGINAARKTLYKYSFTATMLTTIGDCVDSNLLAMH